MFHQTLVGPCFTFQVNWLQVDRPLPRRCGLNGIRGTPTSFPAATIETSCETKFNDSTTKGFGISSLFIW